MIKKLRYRVKKTSDAIALVSVELLLVFIAFFIAIALLIIVIRQVFGNDQAAFDQEIFNWLLPFVSDTNNYSTCIYFAFRSVTHF